MRMQWKLPAWFTKHLGIALLVLVCAVTAGGLLAGFAFRPTVSAPPPLPPTLNLTPAFGLSLTFSSRPPRMLTVDTVLTGNGNAQARLEIDATGTFGAGQQKVGWTLYVQGFTGYECTPKSRWVTPQDLGGGYYSFMSTVPVPVNGDNFLVIDLCWATQSPLTVNSSYFSAALPPVTAAHQTGTLTRTVDLSDNGLAPYQQNDAIPPTTAGPQGWSWTDPLGTGPGDSAANSLLVSGTSIVGVQHASNDTFYSGIAFGVGFGGVIALLLTLSDLARKRQEQSEAVPVTATDHPVRDGDSAEAT